MREKPGRIHITDVRSENDTCFARAVVAAFYPAKRNAERCGSYPDYATVLNLDGIDFPMDLKKIGKCLHYFYTRDKLAAHSVDCGRMNECAIVLPNENDKWLSFDNHNRKERLPFVVYADLECLLKQRERKNVERGAKDTLISVTYRSAWATICAAPTTIPRPPMVELTEDEKREFWLAAHCHVCGKAFQSGDKRVRDHCHLPGRYRGPAHSRCNLNYRNVYVILVFFHNLSSYDAHFIVKKIANDFEDGVDLLPLTKESYISFSKIVKETQTDGGWDRYVKLRFVDSYKFLAVSIETLASYLNKDKLRITRSEYADLNTEDLDLLTCKGVFPYEYVNSADKLRETELPPREVFYSSLTDETVSESDYEHATRVWQRFRVRDLGEYSDLYLKTDVLLLADIFENFRVACLASYGLNPTHYYTLPGYTWDVMLRYTGVRFELLTDIDMVLFVERGIRGGLSQCSLRYVRANNRHVPTYDSSQPTTYLMYYDVNNLYGWAMSELLPYANFRWLDDPENLDVTTVPADSDVGYILEVDLEYPRTCTTPTRTYRCARRAINCPQYLQLGMRLTRVCRVLRFTQSPWLCVYIELNTTLRTRASNEFERNLYKLMNNAVFGKTMKNRSVFSENLVAIKVRRLEVKFNKPVYVGMCILEISKTRLYEFHYDYMVPLYRDRCRIFYTDTDSLIYSLECEDAYERMRRDIDRFDTSDYAKNNAHGMPRVKKVPGLMKDENNGAIMTEFVDLRAKMYTYKVLERNDTKRIKGVKKNVVAKRITFEDYVACLRNARELKTR
ncbi:uncharacterized protein [Temnothorax longispinosus]|uniref:uncharacterized protein n=1 Tax=Temnothorax longispinosus TaxID=300112 RepID=UPI003A997610